MTTLEQHLGDYLRLRRSLGHDLADPARQLPRFVAFLDGRGHATITTAAALEWADQRSTPPGSSAGPKRMTAARGFAKYMAGIDPVTEVPPQGLLTYAARAPRPFIYSPADLETILDRLHGLTPETRAATYTTLIGLLAASGMRIGEAIRLDLDDVDWERGVLLIRESKFGKSRLIPLLGSSVHALREYQRQRQQLRPEPTDPSFFVQRSGRRLSYPLVQQTFRRVVDDERIGVDAFHRPRLHDFRHTFAVRTLLGWYRAGLDVQARIPILSTYLGHREPAHTYWYLSAVPELLACAAERQQARWTAARG